MPPLPKRRHRILTTENGIHGFASWNVESLDDIPGPFDPATDINKVARVWNYEGEVSLPTVHYFALSHIDDSDPEINPVPYWTQLDGAEFHWVEWTVSSESALNAIAATVDDVDKIAKVVDSENNELGYFALAMVVEEEGSFFKIWKRLDNGAPSSWVTWDVPTIADRDLLEIEDGAHSQVVRVADTGEGSPGYYVLLSAVYDGEQVDKTWARLDNTESGPSDPPVLIAPAVYQGEYTGQVNVTATTWTDIMSALPGTFTDKISEGITRSGSTYTVPRDGYYRFTASFMTYGQDCFFGLRLRRAGATVLQRVGFATSSVPCVPVESGLNGIFQANAGDVVTLQYCRKTGTGASTPQNPIDGESMNFGAVSVEWIGAVTVPIGGFDGALVTWEVDPEGSPASIHEIEAYEEDLHKVAYDPSGTTHYYILEKLVDDGEGGISKVWRTLDTPVPDLTVKADKIAPRVDFGGNLGIDATHPGKFLASTGGSLQTVTVYADSAAPGITPVQSIPVWQSGAGKVRFVAGPGATLLPPGVLETQGQYALAHITKVTSNTWLVSGEITIS